MRLQRATTLTVAGLLAVGMVATACGSSSKTATKSSTAATGSTSATTASATQPAGAGDTTGVTSSTIDIGEIADVSGPVPGLFLGAQEGIQAWVAYVNASGGIDGRKVSLTTKDSALSCNTYMSSLASLQSSTFASVGSYAIFDSCGKNTLVAHPDFPDIQGAVLTPATNAYPNVFTPFPSPPGFATTAYQYVKDTFPADIVHTAALYGAAVTEDYEEQSNAAKSIGFKYVYTRGLGITETNFTSDVLRMKNDGIKVVDMQDCDAIEVADFLQEAQQQGLHIDALVSASPYDPNFFTELGKGDGTPLVMGLPVALYLGGDVSIPTVAAYVKYLGVTHPGTKPDLYSVEAFVAGLLFQQAMTAAGPNPSRSALLGAMRKITSFNAGGMIGTTNPGGKVPGVCNVVAGVKNGAFIRAKPATTGYTCDGTFVPYTASS